MKVIYCMSELLDWIDMAYHFNQKYNWKPLLWQTTKKNSNYFDSKFPNSDSINFFKANRGNLESINVPREIILSKSILTQYLKYEKIAVNMMDRMDPTARNFNNSERVQLYYNILEFILNYFNENSPELIIFSESPHSVFTYLIYAVAIENGVNILRFSPTHIEGKTFLTSTLESKPKNFDSIYQDIALKQVVSKEVENYLDKINSRYDNAVPYYMKNIVDANNRSSFRKVFTSSLKSIEYLFKVKPRQGYYKVKKQSIRDDFSHQKLAFTFLRGTFYKLKLQKEYQKFVKASSTVFDLNEKFIYFPLQYQPEKSTTPEGDFFSDQFLAISMLSKVSQGRFKIFVKEHVSQFSPKLKGEQGRGLDFYRELSLLKEVVFVDTSVDSFTLIDKAIAVSTITGTAGFESIIRGKPAIIFGHPWYRDCSGVFFINEVDTLQNSLNKILTNYSVNLEEIKYFLETIFQLSQEIYINPSNLNAQTNSTHSNLTSSITLIEKELSL